jgi:hypothetical protein
MPSVWLTYAWKDNDEGAFDYLVDELGRGGVSVGYDKIQLIPGRRLWEQIGDRIMAPDLGGWAYLLTPNSIASEACREELAYALYRALQRGNDFPLIGLLHQVPISSVPVPLKVRLCVDLRASNWVEQVKAGVENRPPARAAAPSSPFVIRKHENFGGIEGTSAIEIRPHLGDHPNWRVAYPADADNILRIGAGPSGGAGLNGMAFCFEATGQLNGVEMKVFGESTALTPSVSAYVLFTDDLPVSTYFGVSRNPQGVPDRWDRIEVR